ncbi:type I-MYXAN CRISPR-associated protein Cas6/Cmx6 [Haliangium sp.]|uniref:type I-MYXAN CRISPR-associated protein Cas6/Cmx6 n=1 Tax=Haliangium sp. TaxID=2663208 RepID=UPI003D0A1D0F
MHHHVTPYVDAAFTLRGDAIPLDHGYALLAALSRRLPALHEARTWGVHPILGRRSGPGLLTLTGRSQLKLRVPGDDAGRLMALAQQTLDIAGHRVRVGVPRLLPLIPTPHLKARFVTVKGFHEDPEPFRAALQRQLAQMSGLGQDPERIEVQIGPRRVIRAKNHTVVGWAVALTGLDAGPSLVVQQRGLGGRRHLGAGIFVPPPRVEPAPASPIRD